MGQICGFFWTRKIPKKHSAWGGFAPWPCIGGSSYWTLATGSAPKFPLLPTALATEIMQSPSSVCLSVCFNSIFGINWPLTLNFCTWVGHDHISQVIESHDNRSWVMLMRLVRPRSRAVFLVLVNTSPRRARLSVCDGAAVQRTSLAILTLYVCVALLQPPPLLVKDVAKLSKPKV